MRHIAGAELKTFRERGASTGIPCPSSVQGAAFDDEIAHPHCCGARSLLRSPLDGVPRREAAEGSTARNGIDLLREFVESAAAAGQAFDEPLVRQRRQNKTAEDRKP
jgi:hypothetical protein